MMFSFFFLLSSALFILEVSSYAIDDSCRNYKGNDISGDVQQAINEVQDMARNAYIQITQKPQSRTISTIHLLQVLFGMEPSRYPIVGRHLAALAHFYRTDDFIVLCGDSTVQLVPDEVNSDPRGIWVDHVHDWWMPYDQYIPCDLARKPDVHIFRPNAFLIEEGLLFVCPDIFDSPKGRTLAPYKDQTMVGERIDDYILLPVILFHELYHSHVVSPIRKSSFRTRHHVIHEIISQFD